MIKTESISSPNLAFLKSRDSVTDDLVDCVRIKARIKVFMYLPASACFCTAARTLLVQLFVLLLFSNVLLGDPAKNLTPAKKEGRTMSFLLPAKFVNKLRQQATSQTQVVALHYHHPPPILRSWHVIGTQTNYKRLAGSNLLGPTRHLGERQESTT